MDIIYGIMLWADELFGVDENKPWGARYWLSWIVYLVNVVFTGFIAFIGAAIFWLFLREKEYLLMIFGLCLMGLSAFLIYRSVIWTIQLFNTTRFYIQNNK